MIYQEYEDDEVIIRLTTVDPQARLEERIEFNHTSGNFLRISFLQYQIDIKIRHEVQRDSFYITGSFVRSKIGEKMICHLDITSIALHKDSEEAKQQIQREEGVFDGNLILTYLFY